VLFRFQGLTLIELVVASLLGVVVILALGQVDVSRVQMYEYNKNLLSRTTQPTSKESEAGFALKRMIEHLKQADRVVLRNPTWVTDAKGNSFLVSAIVQIRLPPAGGTLAQLRDLSRYRWMEYKFDSATKTLYFYDDIADYTNGQLEEKGGNGCDVVDVVYRDVTGLRARYVDIAKPALVAEPFSPKPDDNNVLEIVVSSIDNYKFGATTVPAVAYTSLQATCDETLCDSGSGLAPSAAPPCPPCC
jgi:hypothetical protein